MKLSNVRSRSHYSTGSALNQSAVQRSVRHRVGSLAEENEVRNFNKPRTSESIPPSQPQRI